MTNKVNELGWVLRAKAGIARECEERGRGDAGMGEGVTVKMQDRKEWRPREGRQARLGA